MNTKYLLPVLGLAALPFLQSSKPAADSLRFAPGEDTTVSMEFNNSMEFFLEDFSMEMMGQDMSELMGDVEASVNMTIEVDFTDTYSKTADGRPLAFTRVFGEGAINGEFTGAAQGDSETNSFELIDGMDGQTVMFKWDSEEDTYIKSYPEDEEGDEELLEGLAGRVDLAFMLPSGEVSVDDEWKIDATKLSEILVPGGDLNYDTPDGDRDRSSGNEDGIDDEMVDAMRSLFAGDVTGTYKGLNEEGLAEIVVKLDISGDKNMADLIMSAIEKMAESSGEDVDPSQIPDFSDFTVDMALEGEGVLLWDPRAGHVVSFSMTAETEMSLSIGMSMEPQPGMNMEMTGQVSMGGSAELNMTASH
jgi:hypothetical protein